MFWLRMISRCILDMLSSGMPLSLQAVAALVDAGLCFFLLAGLAALLSLTEDTSEVA